MPHLSFSLRDSIMSKVRNRTVFASTFHEENSGIRRIDGCWMIFWSVLSRTVSRSKSLSFSFVLKMGVYSLADDISKDIVY